MNEAVRKRICVYCGSRPGVRQEYVAAARELGQLAAQRGIGLIYGGSDLGMMGQLAQACLDGGGEMTGVIPQSLHEKVAHPKLTDLHVVDSMHERKMRMFELADAMIALPGGVGTVEELMEVLAWAQLKFHRKPCGLLNVCGYYDKLLDFLDHAVAEEFLKQKHRDLLIVAATPEELLARLGAEVS